MATLSGKTTSGQSAWDKYISSNNKWKELNLLIENKMEAVFMDSKGEKILGNLKQKEVVKLTDNKTKTIDKTVYAQVTYKNKKGLVPINKIRKPTSTDVLKEEAIALENLDSIIKKIVKQVGPFDLTIKGDPRRVVYSGITGARNVTEKVLGREAKADFTITSSKGDEIFVSHKKAGGAKAFQQYGGVTDKAGKRISKHPEVEQFLRNVAQNIENDKLKMPMYHYIKDSTLIGLAGFGHDYGKSFGLDNVTIIGQGAASITPHRSKENLFVLDFNDHLVHNGDTKALEAPQYRACLAGTYRAGRGFDIDGFRYSGTRIGIYTEDFVIRRSGATEV